MNEIREVKKSFCVLSVAYIVLGLVLMIWPDISVKTFCYVFGIGMLIFGGTYMILYFTRNRLKGVMQSEMVLGVIGLATGFYILLKLDYVLEIIPFAMGIIALMGAMVKLQDAIDLRHLAAVRWYIMLIWAALLFVLGVVLVANPFEELDMFVVVIAIGVSLILDGLGNLVGIFWIGHAMKQKDKKKETELEVPDPKILKFRKKAKDQPIDSTAEEILYPDVTGPDETSAGQAGEAHYDDATEEAEIETVADDKETDEETDS